MQHASIISDRSRMTLTAGARLGPYNVLSVLVVGVVIALISTLPLINLAAPLLAIAAMIHRVQAWRSPRGITASQ